MNELAGDKLDRLLKFWAGGFGPAYGFRLTMVDINRKRIAQRIVEEARTWRGTRFQHQGRVKGLGVDCVGFISEVAKGAGIKLDSIPANYHPHEDGSLMLRLLNYHMEFVPTEEMQAGDVLALTDEAVREPNVPRHLAIVTEITPRTVFVIHASQRGVKEHRINDAWRRRIHSVWRIKNA